MDYVLQHGIKLRRTGICFYFLAAHAVPGSDQRLAWVQRLVGTILLVSAKDRIVITLY